MLNATHRNQLHQIATDAIKHGLQTGDELPVDPAGYDAELRQKRATFVTLQIDSQLRGCIGILEALRPLAEDVAHNAYAAAFSDTRFTPLTADEFDQLEIHISILGTPEPVRFASEQDLIEQIRPGIDGLILEDGYHRGTFLPAVWESIDSSREFLLQLKQKAGLPADYWSDTLRVQRYSVEAF